MRNLKVLVAWTAGLMVFLAVSGCGPKAIPAEKAPAFVPPEKTVLSPGDTVELKFYYNKELNEQQVIRADGKITLQYVGEVTAAGLTPTQLSTELDQVYAKYVKNPGVAVFVRNSYRNRVIIAGEVNRPGIIEMPASLSAVEAIMIAGGVNLTSGETKQVIIMRKQPNGKRIGYELNIDNALAGAEVDNFMLQPDDIVFVPRTAIVNINQFMDQYVGGILPRAVIYSRPLGDGSVTFDSGQSRR